MPKKVPGIFNPFAKKKKPKKNPKSSLEEVNEAEGIYVPPSVTLDGDSYGITFIGLDDPKDAASKLVKLIVEINKTHPEELNRRGIYVNKKCEPDELLLKDGDESITVYVGNDTQTEIPAYRRIAHTLLSIPVRELLVENQVSLYERG